MGKESIASHFFRGLHTISTPLYPPQRSHPRIAQPHASPTGLLTAFQRALGQPSSIGGPLAPIRPCAPRASLSRVRSPAPRHSPPHLSHPPPPHRRPSARPRPRPAWVPRQTLPVRRPDPAAAPRPHRALPRFHAHYAIDNPRALPIAPVGAGASALREAEAAQRIFEIVRGRNARRNDARPVLRQRRREGHVGRRGIVPGRRVARGHTSRRPWTPATPVPWRGLPRPAETSRAGALRRAWPEPARRSARRAAAAARRAGSFPPSARPLARPLKAQRRPRIVDRAFASISVTHGTMSAESEIFCAFRDGPGEDRRAAEEAVGRWGGGAVGRARGGRAAAARGRNAVSFARRLVAGFGSLRGWHAPCMACATPHVWPRECCAELSEEAGRSSPRDAPRRAHPSALGCRRGGRAGDEEPGREKREKRAGVGREEGGGRCRREVLNA